MNSRPLGRVRERLTISCFFTANGGLFERPKAAFFTVAAVVAMQRMALGMVVTTRRKTRFPHGVTTVTKKGEADNSRHGFLYLNPAIIDKNGLYVRLYDYLCIR